MTIEPTLFYRPPDWTGKLPRCRCCGDRYTVVGPDETDEWTWYFTCAGCRVKERSRLDFEDAHRFGIVLRK